MLHRDMWSTMVTLIPMVLEDTLVMLYILMKSDYVFIKYHDPNMVSSNTIEFRVTMVGHMSQCSVGKRPKELI